MTTKMAQRFMNNTCFRVADPKRSIEFYQKMFGMKLLKTVDLETQGATNYILGLSGPKTLYNNEPFYQRGGLLQLSHKHGNTVDNFQANNGNKEPHRGFGHICFSVPNIESFCARLEGLGVNFQKRLSDGRMKTIAFALDPDGYWIELISNEESETETPTDNLRLNHSMIRVKDKDASLEFYVKKLGMSLVDTRDFPEAEFTLFFLSYNPDQVSRDGRASTEGLIELTYNYGSEKDSSVNYHTGNEDPKGFSHFGISVEKPEEFVRELQSRGVSVLSASDSRSSLVTVADPDGYAVQILPISDYTISGKI